MMSIIVYKNGSNFRIWMKIWSVIAQMKPIYSSGTFPSGIVYILSSFCQIESPV